MSVFASAFALAQGDGVLGVLGSHRLDFLGRRFEIAMRILGFVTFDG
jgi:hypothetical protein